MVATGIERMPTVEERQNMQIVGEKTPTDVFYNELAKKGQEFAKAHKPFDEQCARMDFQDKMDTVKKESERINSYVRPEDVSNIKIDLDKYGDEDRFEEIVVDEELENKLIDGLRTQVKVGYTIKYKCKPRGHGVSVFMPTKTYEERFEKKKLVKED